MWVAAEDQAEDQETQFPMVVEMEYNLHLHMDLLLKDLMAVQDVEQHLILVLAVAAALAV
jgi:3-hydroxyisobutyrate dehydrogenase-like beta-hydroxyacid dehydrogenase